MFTYLPLLERRRHLIASTVVDHIVFCYGLRAHFMNTMPLRCILHRMTLHVWFKQSLSAVMKRWTIKIIV